MHLVLIAALKQQLLKRDRTRFEHQGQEPHDTRMHANAARRFEIDIKVKQALEPVLFPAANLQSALAMPMVSRDELPRMFMHGPDVAHEPVDQRFLDGVAPDQPAMVDEVCKI